ncbi:phosphatidylcholine/phosphatidylserine synthase [Gordonia desulfuricans]|uniref:Phosphatidylcholine/phosphatidylserine synthase n=1 Tax=Gordonia desulfuricans TaxID=89051 RepID=A0A7K3LW16_9ACTN|nr:MULTISPECIES: phosphatidylcholine/phosphatidylserine synthase [Gordonia]KOY49666.1 CDP-diacylglycerol--serine O-phosphatidyltransferase [Gordonia sp. NB41Y]NDK92131.1 phosphatidylcholine/phosphatidylserine synthase [Gordonia desulfuricans]WLP92350.1 phosphatidylcholine/phosphatidylserine synthase [Gordonia sp. NB41Y]
MNARPDRKPGAARTPTARVASRTGRRTTADQQSRIRRQASASRMFVPSALTILAICAGMTAIRFAVNGNVNAAMALLVAAALLDGIDGRVARMMGATTKMGAEIDSLADAINFGVVPAGIVYFALLDGSDIGWGIGLIYCCAIVLRLARFNTLLDDDDAPGYTRDFFVGVPAPAAAICALLPIGLYQQFGDGWWTSNTAIGAWLLLVALLAVSRVPTYSFKASKVSPRALPVLLILVAIGAALLLTYPYVLMMILIGLYAAHIPFAWRNRRWVASRPEHWDAPPRERRAERRALARSQPGRRIIPGRRQTMKKSDGRLGLHRPTGRRPPSTSGAPTDKPGDPTT